MELLDSKYAQAYYKVMKQQISSKTTDICLEKAKENFARLLEENPNQTKDMTAHTHVSIFPAIAFYKALMETVSAKEAMTIMEKGAAAISSAAGKKYANIVKLPGFKGVFLKIFSKGAKEGFGSKAGFVHEFLTDTKEEVAFNVTKCPYQDYCVKYECPELVHIFCKNDEYAYGGLPGIRFIRTQTIGTGGEYCDFRLKR